MESCKISESWPTDGLETHDARRAWAVDQLHPDFDRCDELWRFDEMALPGTDASFGVRHSKFGSQPLDIPAVLLLKQCRTGAVTISGAIRGIDESLYSHAVL
jgi:hypothetical protein